MAKRILCIEDDSEMRSIVRIALESAGYEIEEAENGKMGLDRAMELLPDLILCDINMPGMNGFQTLEELRKHKLKTSIPFIFMTGENPSKYLRMGMNLGADDFILKPIDMNDLIKAIQVRFQETERKKAETQRAVGELSESITRAMPHELRTPMTGILGLAELLKIHAKEMSPDEVKDLAELLYSSATRMNKTLEKFWIHTQSLLLPHDIAKLTASCQTGTKNTEQCIRHIGEKLAESFNRADDLIFDFSPIAVAISEKYFEQTIYQILENAFKFSDAGSKITVTTSVDSNFGKIIIEDHGRGMSDDQIIKIHACMQFDRDHYEQQGIGLGLTIAKQLIKSHNGTLEMKGEIGKGVTMSILLPLLH